MDRTTCATFAGQFSFAQDRHVGPLPVWEPMNPWVPTDGGTGIKVLHQWSDRHQAFHWIQFIAEQAMRKFDLLLQGEVWYQGTEAMDTGRLYADTEGSIARQTIKSCPNMAGAVARNDVALLRGAPRDALMTTDGFGRTAAMLAAMFNHWAVLRHLLLLPEGIDWSQTQTAQAGYIGRTALHYLCANPPTAASAQQHAEVVNLLPDTLPASILNAPDSDGLTPLLLAVKSRNMILLQWLLSHGADPDLASTSLPATRPITAALKLKDAAYLEQLLAAGAAINFLDSSGAWPLSSALESQHADHLQLLVQYGADLDAHHKSILCPDVHGPSFGGSQTIRQIITGFPAGKSGAARRTAMAQGLAARRHLVVLTLGARVAPALPRDVLQLVCQYASLTL